MSKVQYLILVVTLVGVQMGFQYFLSHGNDTYSGDITSQRGVYVDKNTEFKKMPISISKKVPVESNNFSECDGGGVDYLAGRINEISAQIESLSDSIDDLFEYDNGKNVVSSDVRKAPELSEDEIYSIYQKALSIMEDISLDSDSKDRFDKEGEVMGLLSTIPASRRSEFHNKLF